MGTFLYQLARARLRRLVTERAPRHEEPNRCVMSAVGPVFRNITIPAKEGHLCPPRGADTIEHLRVA